MLPIAYYLIFKYAPMLGNIITFRKYVPGGDWLGSRWIGLKYFEMFFFDPNFWNIFLNTLRISIFSLIFGFPASVIFALLLNEWRNQRFRKVIQAISYFPHFLSIVVICGMLMDVLSPSGGVINQLVVAVTGERIRFMQESQYKVE